MKIHELVFISFIPAALALTGCDRGGGVGVGSSETQSQSQSASQDLSQSRALGDRQDKTQAVMVPFPSLAVSSLLGDDAQGVKAMGKLIIAYEELLEVDDVPGSYPSAPPPNFDPQVIRQNISMIGWPSKLGYQKILDGEWTEGVDILKKDRMLSLIAAATQPGAGWPVKVLDHSKIPSGLRPEAGHHAENMAVAACFASKALALVHQSLPKGALFRSAEELREQVRETYLGLPLSALEGELKACREHLREAKITLNLTGVQGQEWRIGDLYVTRDSRGTAFTKNGTPWFGDGLVEGKRLEVAASHVITSEMIMAAGNTRSSDATTSQETVGNVGVGK